MNLADALILGSLEDSQHLFGPDTIRKAEEEVTQLMYQFQQRLGPDIHYPDRRWVSETG